MRLQARAGNWETKEKMGFIGVYKAIYDYAATSEEELAMKEGDILYVLDKGGEDGWWKAKKKASADDDDEPEGLVPENYVEEVCRSTPVYHVRIYQTRRGKGVNLSGASE